MILSGAYLLEADMLSTSRCHKGLSCSNNRPNDVNNRDRKEIVDPLRNAGVDFDLPSFEGTIVEDNSAVALHSTCCIDNWLMIFRNMSIENPAVRKVLLDSYSNAYPKIFNIISMIGKESFLQAPEAKTMPKFIHLYQQQIGIK